VPGQRRHAAFAEFVNHSVGPSAAGSFRWRELKRSLADRLCNVRRSLHTKHRDRRTPHSRQASSRLSDFRMYRAFLPSTRLSRAGGLNATTVRAAGARRKSRRRVPCHLHYKPVHRAGESAEFPDSGEWEPAGTSEAHSPPVQITAANSVFRANSRIIIEVYALRHCDAMPRIRRIVHWQR